MFQLVSCRLKEIAEGLVLILSRLSVIRMTLLQASRRS